MPNPDTTLVIDFTPLEPFFRAFMWLTVAVAVWMVIDLWRRERRRMRK